MHRDIRPRPLFEAAIVRRAVRDAWVKLDPRKMIKNPVMFVVEIGSVFTSVLFVHGLVTKTWDSSPTFIGAIALWLWFTVLFANFAEAMAEGRGKAQADALRRARRDVEAIRLSAPS
ncbi:MAG TPA: potassium-transporting ATPase subunit B, partial [Polyangium sp.]|nr:potassium-transporting ATPase subunit B [Polyangium sp.]